MLLVDLKATNSSNRKVLKAMKNVFEVLEERGYIEQLTHPQEIKELFGKESVSFYIGIDPTADSLHVGHFVSLMVASHMQKFGHKPIILVGGGTATIRRSIWKNRYEKNAFSRRTRL